MLLRLRRLKWVSWDRTSLRLELGIFKRYMALEDRFGDAAKITGRV